MIPACKTRLRRAAAPAATSLCFYLYFATRIHMSPVFEHNLQAVHMQVVSRKSYVWQRCFVVLGCPQTANGRISQKACVISHWENLLVTQQEGNVIFGAHFCQTQLLSGEDMLQVASAACHLSVDVIA